MLTFMYAIPVYNIFNTRAGVGVYDIYYVCEMNKGMTYDIDCRIRSNIMAVLLVVDKNYSVFKLCDNKLNFFNIIPNSCIPLFNSLQREINTKPTINIEFVRRYCNDLIKRVCYHI